MIDDLNTLAKMAAALMERIEEDYGDEIQVRTIAIAVEVDMPDSTTMVVSCSDDRGWVQAAFLEQILDQLEARCHQSVDDDPDD